jgi:hypothetical protein
MIDRMHRVGGPIEVSDEAHVEAAVSLLLDGLTGSPDATRRRR